PDRFVERRIGRVPSRRAHVDHARTRSMLGDPIDGANRRGDVGARRAGTRENAQRVNPRRRRDAERPAGDNAGDVRAVARRRRWIAVISLIAAWLAADEVADPLDTVLELAVGPAHAAVDDVHVDAAAVAFRRKAAVKRKAPLIDAIEIPWDAAVDSGQF